MFVKIKSSNFIDALQFELINYSGRLLIGILKDDQGSICGSMERNISNDPKQINWTGLNDLPYGQYTLNLSYGDEEMKMNLVKRV